ncbi:MAG: Oxygen sensor protein DosP [Candidatus Scalindua brodae]|uniref:Oxygen sensor protein DosP n=1 Tax=Candidatus Scalindua brodae TaxID=237368 RepID=A0A0B0EM49_9BACT|nr:MAG: Oxygen sensor protein DosP [Candidatus Scalindua brodae]
MAISTPNRELHDFFDQPTLPTHKKYEALRSFFYEKKSAEGVETKEQISFLHKHKCDCLQGFYFCRPLPAEVATQFLKEILSEGKSEGD